MSTQEKGGSRGDGAGLGPRPGAVREVGTVKKIEVLLRYEKETPGTIRYQETPSEDRTPPRLKTIYVPKLAAGNPPPRTIKVTVEGVAEESARTP